MSVKIPYVYKIHQKEDGSWGNIIKRRTAIPKGMEADFHKGMIPKGMKVDIVFLNTKEDPIRVKYSKAQPKVGVKSKKVTVEGGILPLIGQILGSLLGLGTKEKLMKGKKVKISDKESLKAIYDQMTIDKLIQMLMDLEPSISKLHATSVAKQVSRMLQKGVEEGGLLTLPFTLGRADRKKKTKKAGLLTLT